MAGQTKTVGQTKMMGQTKMAGQEWECMRLGVYEEVRNRQCAG